MKTSLSGPLPGVFYVTYLEMRWDKDALCDEGKPSNLPNCACVYNAWPKIVTTVELKAMLIVN